MARPAADSVRVTWTGTGTGTMSLGVVVAGFQAFPADFDGEVVSYAIENATGTQRENGFGTYTAAGNTLTRDFVTFSTAGAPLKQSFTSGDKHVRVTALAHDVIENRATTDPGASNDITQGYISGRARWLNTTTDLLWSCVDHTTGAAIWAPILYLRNSGTFNPAAINLAATRGYNTFVQSGAITFALSGATHVDNATATVRITGDGTNNIGVDGVTVLWADGSIGARQWSGTQTVAFWYSSNIGAALAFAPSGASMSAAAIRTALLTVDGTGSGIDADLLDGQHASVFQPKYLSEEFEFPDDKTYSLVGYAPFAGTISTLKHFTISGTCTVAVAINGTPVTGLSAVSMSIAPGSATATAANVVAVGDRIEVTFTNTLAGIPSRANLTLLFG